MKLRSVKKFSRYVGRTAAEGPRKYHDREVARTTKKLVEIPFGLSEKTRKDIESKIWKKFKGRLASAGGIPGNVAARIMATTALRNAVKKHYRVAPRNYKKLKELTFEYLLVARKKDSKSINRVEEIITSMVRLTDPKFVVELSESIRALGPIFRDLVEPEKKQSGGERKLYGGYELELE